MEKKHITKFKIENFKRFSSFEMSNLGQFNLIVGDNNVGKTTLLEALTLEEDRVPLIYTLAVSFLQKNDIIETWEEDTFEKYLVRKEFWIQILTNINKPLRLKHEYLDNSKFDVAIEFIEEKNLTEKDKIAISKKIPASKQPELWLKYHKDDKYEGAFGRYAQESQEMNDSALISSADMLRMNVGYNSQHLSVYYDQVNPFRERRILFEKSLRYILNDLDEVRPHKFLDSEVLGVVLKNSEVIFPITQFGDGVIKIMRIILGIITSRTARIMIDEIESGIHFTRQREFWKIVINLCSSYGVQLFATTHSLECQRALIESLQDDNSIQFQKDVRNISLIEDNEGIIKAVTYDYEQFENAINIGFNTRGGFV